MTPPGYGGPGRDPFGGHDPFAANASGSYGGPPVSASPPPFDGRPPVWTGQPDHWGQHPVTPVTANTFATLSLVLAFLFAPAGAVLGHLGLRQIARTGQPGRNRAVIGITLSYYLIGLTIVGLVGWLVFGGSTSHAPVAAGPAGTAVAPPTAGTPTVGPNSATPATPSALPWPPPAGSIVALTEEPTCQALRDITSQRNQQVGTMSGSNGSAGEWTGEERDSMTKAAAAYRTAADRLVPYLAQTPNRFVQELYGQYIAYSRVFADSIPGYVAEDRFYSEAADAAANTVDDLCLAIADAQPEKYVPMVPPITDLPAPPPVDPANPRPAVSAGMAGCQDWQALSTLDDAVERDPTQAGRYADTFIDLGHRSGNPTVLDLAAHGAQYLRVAAVAPTADEYKRYRLTASYVAWTMLWACMAVDR